MLGTLGHTITQIAGVASDEHSTTAARVLLITRILKAYSTYSMQKVYNSLTPPRRLYYRR